MINYQNYVQKSITRRVKRRKDAEEAHLKFFGILQFWSFISNFSSNLMYNVCIPHFNDKN